MVYYDISWIQKMKIMEKQMIKKDIRHTENKHPNDSQNLSYY